MAHSAHRRWWSHSCWRSSHGMLTHPHAGCSPVTALLFLKASSIIYIIISIIIDVKFTLTAAASLDEAVGRSDSMGLSIPSSLMNLPAIQYFHGSADISFNVKQ